MRASLLWNNSAPDTGKFCSRFFTLALYALTSSEIGHESIDDIIQLAECLVRSRDTFNKMCKDLVTDQSDKYACEASGELTTFED